MTPTNKDSFHEFLRIWLYQLENILTQLQDSPRGPSDKISRVMDHHDVFFLAKSDLARRDPALALSLPWLSPLSRAALWMGGWRPAAVYRIVLLTSTGLSAAQAAAMEAMREATRAEEAAVEREIARVQNGMVGLVMKGREKAAERRIFAGMERVAVAADEVRREAIGRVMRILSPGQGVEFLVQLGMMELGLYGLGHGSVV
ncbi:protein DOG1-like 4 [Typha angustifolia]|uniref:protein DOG1-like 4 n=1 Tax=Typha angustifolia TaxID=59011 RepID=UPI003C2DAB27